jgi:hypothetical protein
MTNLLKYKHLNDIKVLSEQQHNLITGLMLGDGHLGRPYKETYLSVGRAQKDLNYLIYQYNFFKSFCSDNGFYSNRKTYKDGNLHLQCGFHTRYLPIFTKYHNIWYKRNEESNRYIKIIPNDLQLNSEIIATWLCDDGYIRTLEGKKHRFQINFSTDSFTKTEVLFLCDLLSDRYNEAFVIEKHTEKRFKIRSSSDTAARELIKDIDKSFPEGMQRKRLWDDPDARFYSNPPTKTTGLKILKAGRDKEIINFISKNIFFKAIDLANHLGWGYIVDGKLATGRRVYAYLDNFIKDGYLNKVLKNVPRSTYFYEATEKGKLYFTEQSLILEEVKYYNKDKNEV